MGSEKIEFDILVKQNQLQRSLDEAANKAESITSIMSDGFTSAVKEASHATENLNGSMGNFLNTTVGVAAGQFAFQLLATAVNFVRSSITESIGAFSEQEDAVNKLRQSFILTGGASQSAVDGIQAFATGLESVSKFSDDNIIKNVAFVKSLGATSAASKEMVTAAANLSAVLGGSLEENTEKLGKTLSGVTTRLSQYIPELKTLTKEQLEAGEAARIVNEKFSGSAANDLNTYSGATAQLKNTFNNLQETIGELIVKSAPFQFFLKESKTYIDGLNSSVKASAIVTASLAGEYIGASKTASQLSTDVADLQAEINRLQEEMKSGQGGGDEFFFADASQGASSLQLQIDSLIAKQATLVEKLKYNKEIKPEVKETASKRQEDDSEKQNRLKTNAEIVALDQQLISQRKTLKEQDQISKINDELQRNEAEIVRINEFELRKVEIENQKKISTAEATLTGDALVRENKKIHLEKLLALEDASGKKQAAMSASLLKTRAAAEDARAAYEKKQKDEKLKDEDAFFKAATSLSSSKNKELAAIGKAAAITRVAIDTPPAVSSSFRFGSEIGGPITGAIFAGIALAAQTAQAAQIAGVAFAEGGFIGGLNGASIGADNRVAQVRDGEMILNASQQKNLMDMINSGGGGGDIVVKVDGVEIARAVRTQINKGFKLA